MPEQLLLPGIDPPPPPLRRRRSTAQPRERLPRSLFFAILPPPEVAASVAALAAQLDGAHALKAKLTDPGRLHVTLHHLGDHTAVPRKVLQAALDAAAAVAPPAFEVVFDEVLRFDKSRAFVLGCSDERCSAELVAFRQRLGEALADVGFKPERGFTPHMTLAYTPRKVARQPIAPAVRWQADSFVLFESHVGEHVYELRGRWPA